MCEGYVGEIGQGPSPNGVPLTVQSPTIPQAAPRLRTRDPETEERHDQCSGPLLGVHRVDLSSSPSLARQGRRLRPRNQDPPPDSCGPLRRESRSRRPLRHRIPPLQAPRAGPALPPRPHRALRGQYCGSGDTRKYRSATDPSSRGHERDVRTSRPNPRPPPPDNSSHDDHRKVRIVRERAIVFEDLSIYLRPLERL